MRRKRKEKKPILQVLLLSSLAINTTLGLVVLARRNHLAQATEKKEAVAPPAMITLEGATVEPKAPTGAKPVTPPEPVTAKKNVVPLATVKRSAPAKTDTPMRERDKISFFPAPALYRLSRDTVLVTRRDGARILIPQGTLVRVAGMTAEGKALVISRRGNPDGLIPRSSLVAINGEESLMVPGSSAPSRTETVIAQRRQNEAVVPLRLSGGPTGGSIGLGSAQIHVGPNGQISGSLSR